MNRNAPQHLRMIQLNLNKSLNAQLHMLNTTRPNDWDVLLIQEPWMAFNGSRATPHWRVLYPKAYFTDTTKPLRSLIMINTSIPTDCYEQIQFQSADVSGIYLKTNDRKFIILNIYNDCKNNESMNAVREFLLTKFPDEYIPNDTHVIIGGDFNRHHPWWESDENEHLSSSEQMIRPLLDLITTFNLHMTLPHGIPTLQAFSTGNWTRPDNVWCSSHSADLIVRCDTSPQTRGPNTDHVPIHIVLNTNLPRNEPRPTRNFRIVDWEKFIEYLTATLEGAPRPRRINSLAEFRAALDTINGAIRVTIDAKVPLTKPLPHTKRWWNSELNALRKKKNRLANLSHKWRGLPDHHSHEEHSRATKEYAALIERTKRQHWEAWLLNASDRNLWTANKYATDPPTDYGRTKMPTLAHTLRDGTQQVATANNDKSAALANALFPLPPPEPAIPATCYPQPADEYFHIFTREQIRLAATKLDAFKAPGPDGVPNVVLKKSIDALIDHIYFIFRAIFELETYPDEWKESITVVLRKPGKPSYEDPKAYRPIALLNTLGKLFSTIVTDDLSYFCETRHVFPPNQFGGRPARTTTDSTLLLTHTIKEAWRNKKVASVLFLDVQGAFPNVVKEVLLHDMKTRGVPTAYIHLTNAMLTGRTTRLSFDDFISNPIPIDNGNNQGCPLSMLFYAFYNTGLLELSPPNSSDESQFGFVDDVALLAIGRDLVETHQKLKSMMEREGGAFGWSESHYSQFELTKLALMNFSPKPAADVPLSISQTSLNRSTTIKPVNTYRFLGVLFDPKLKWRAQHERATRSTGAWTNLIRRLTRTASGISAKGMRHLYLAVAVPRMTYAAEIWYTIPHKTADSHSKRTGSIKFTNFVRSTQRQAAIAMLGAMRTTAGDVLNAHALIPPPHLLFQKALTNSATRLVSLPEFHPLYKPVQQTIRRTVRRHKSPLHVLFMTTKVKSQRYETILPARRRRDYGMLAHVQIDDDRTTAITNANNVRGIAAFTDGSGYEGGIGAAAVLTVNGLELRTLRYRLGSETAHTVYEAEIFAVLLALHLISQVARPISRVTIGLDNQAVLLGLQNQKPKPSHYLLDKVHDALEDLQVTEARKRGIAIPNYRLGRGRVKLTNGTVGWKDWGLKRWCKVKFIWTPGHEGIGGNEKADEEAKLAAEEGSSPRRQLPTWVRRKGLPVSVSATRQRLKSEAKKCWKNEWSKSPRYEISVNIDRSLPSDNFLHIIDQLRRNQASILIQLRTRHLPLNANLLRIKRADTSDCPHCRSGTRETILHYILFCPHYESARSYIREIINKERNALAFLLGKRDGIPPLLRYVGATKRFQSTFGDVTPPHDFSLRSKESKSRITGNDPTHPPPT